MNVGSCCPYCGYPLEAVDVGEARHSVTTGTNADTRDTIEALSREVKYLRQTVARLRGSGASRFNPLSNPTAGAGSTDDF